MLLAPLYAAAVADADADAVYAASAAMLILRYYFSCCRCCFLLLRRGYCCRRYAFISSRYAATALFDYALFAFSLHAVRHALMLLDA